MPNIGQDCSLKKTWQKNDFDARSGPPIFCAKSDKDICAWRAQVLRGIYLVVSVNMLTSNFYL
jgi:hypothetical protein